MNCHLLNLHFVVPNCSMGVYQGLKPFENLQPCTPGDILFGDLKYSPGGIPDHVLENQEMCLYDCEKEEYTMYVTSGPYDAKVLDDHLEMNSVYDSNLTRWDAIKDSNGR